MDRISKCRVCGNPNLLEVLSLGRQALTGRFPLPEEPDPPSGPLELLLCDGGCGLLQLSCTYSLPDMYGPTYGYRSSLNQTMIDHLREVSERLKGLCGLRAGDAVLDIGSNDGTFLKTFGPGIRRTGIDPSAEKFRHEYPRDVDLIVDFFGPGKVTGPFKLVTSIAMFYDIEAPLRFMGDVRGLLARDGLWFSEQSHMADMIRNMTYDSICHEHLNYYNLRQILWMAGRAGLKVLDAGTNRINGASFFFVAARSDAPYEANRGNIDRILNEEAEFSSPAPFERFKADILDHRKKVLDFFESNRSKRIIGYGASTKGNVVIQFCGITREKMPAIAEKYPWKFGRVVPVTRIPIVSEEEARLMRPDYFFVFPWHFRDEIVLREQLFLRGGGRLVFPLPEFTVTDK